MRLCKGFSVYGIYMYALLFYCLWHIGIFIFWFMAYEGTFFSVYKNVKSFYTGKVAKIYFLFMAYRPVYFFFYGIWGLIPASLPPLEGPITKCLNLTCKNHFKVKR